MPSPFPGMDPYLEHPALWPGLHSRLIVGLADDLGPILRPRYYVEVEERVYLLTPESPRKAVPTPSRPGPMGRSRPPRVYRPPPGRSPSRPAGPA